MTKPLITMPLLMLAGLCVLAGCGGKSPAASTAAPAASEGLAHAPAPNGNAPQGGGVKLDDPGKSPSPDGGVVKVP
jgi:hypothetical protein